MSKEKKEKRSFAAREIHEYPPVLQAAHVQEITGFSVGKTYELLRSEDCPTVRRGKRMVVPRDLFWKFLTGEAVKGTQLEFEVAI